MAVGVPRAPDTARPTAGTVISPLFSLSLDGFGGLRKLRPAEAASHPHLLLRLRWPLSGGMAFLGARCGPAGPSVLTAVRLRPRLDCGSVLVVSVGVGCVLALPIKNRTSECAQVSSSVALRAQGGASERRQSSRG